MTATLDSSLIVDNYVKKTEREKKVNDDTLSVFDLDSKGWRSFRIDRLISIDNEPYVT